MDKQLFGLAALLIALAACATAVPIERTEEVETPFDEIESLAIPTTETAVTAPANIPDQFAINRRIIDEEDYRLSGMIPFDGIPPVYDPIFVAAQDSPLTDDELVMGVAWGGEAKAYPISVMRHREMVNDELGGIPTLVTW